MPQQTYLHIQFLLNSDSVRLSDLNVFKWGLGLSGVARASWASVSVDAGIPKRPPVGLQSQPNSLIAAQTPENTNGHLPKGRSCQPHLKKKSMDFSTGLSIFDEDCAPGSITGHCSSLDRTLPLPWLCCLIHKIKVTILILSVKRSETHWQRGCGTAELSQLKWLHYFCWSLELLKSLS